MTRLESLLEREYMLGSKGNLRGAIHYLNEYTIIYACGNIAVIYDINSKKQQFITGMKGISVISPSPCRRLIALTETENSGVVHIFETSSRKRKKVLNSGDVNNKNILHISFSYDSKLCLVLGGPPEYNLTLWNIEKGAKVIASVKLATPSGKCIYRADLSPDDSSIICVSGNAVLRFFRVIDGCFRPITVDLKREPQNHSCHCWLDPGQVLVGTTSGEILFLENFEVKNVLLAEPDGKMPVCSISPFEKGFIVGRCGIIQIYHQIEGDKSMFLLAKTFKLPNNSSSITCIAISSSEESLTLTTADNHMFSLSFVNVDIMKDDGDIFFPTLPHFHGVGPQGKSHILGLDTCIWKPIIATCGLDRCVKIWNYETKVMQFSQTFHEDVNDVSLHPTGLQILLCCTNRVLLCSILVGSFRIMHEIELQSCQFCCFSNGGQYFALAYNAFVQIYNTHTFESLCTLRGHSMTVTRVCWKHDDTTICTIGIDGAICTWSVPKGIRIIRKVDSMSSYRSGNLDPNFNYAFLTCSDQTIKRLNLASMVFDTEIEIDSLGSNDIAIIDDNLFLTGVTTSSNPGGLSLVEIENDNTMRTRKDWQCHSKPMTCLKLSRDSKHIISAGEDGTLGMFRLLYFKHGSKHHSKEEKAKLNSFSELILVSKSDLDDKTNKISSLKSQMEKISLDSEHQLRLKDIEYKETIERMEIDYELKAKEAKKIICSGQHELKKLKECHDEENKEAKAKNLVSLSKLHQDHKDQIDAESKRLDQLIINRVKWNEEWELENNKLVEEQTQELNQISSKFESKIMAQNEYSLDILKKKEEILSQHKKNCTLIEEDCDKEVEREIGKYESKLSQIQSINKLLQQENEIMKKSYNGLVKDLDEQKETIASLEKKQEEIWNNTIHLERVLQLKKIIVSERDKEIKGKDEDIASTQIHNEELNSFKFKLNESIAKMKEKLEPQAKQIALLVSKRKEKDLELGQTCQERNELKLFMKDLQLKCKGTDKEILRLSEKIKVSQKDYFYFVHDLSVIVKRAELDKEIKSSLLPLFRRYIDGKEMNDRRKGGAEKSKEINKKLERMKANIKNSNKVALKQQKIHQSEYSKLNKEYAYLQKELDKRQEEAASLANEEELLMQEYQRYVVKASSV